MTDVVPTFAEPIAGFNRTLALARSLLEACLLPRLRDAQPAGRTRMLVGGGHPPDRLPRAPRRPRRFRTTSPSRELHRRLYILIYFNKDWQPEYGGNIVLWDEHVKVCHHSFSPIFNRCVVFETNEVSYHGVTAVKCPPGQARKSFAAYYYTKEAPAHWTGVAHSTIFKARPDEVIKGNVMMPLEKARQQAPFGPLGVQEEDQELNVPASRRSAPGARLAIDGRLAPRLSVDSQSFLPFRQSRWARRASSGAMPFTPGRIGRDVYLRQVWILHPVARMASAPWRSRSSSWPMRAWAG